MSDYSYKELMQMQNDAIKRVEEMQRRARQSAGLQEEQSQPKPQVKKAEPERIPMPDNYLESLKSYAAKNAEEKITEEKKIPPKKSQADSNGFLGDLNIDKDTALILSVVLLLAEENADETLIMALLYMLT